MIICGVPLEGLAMIKEKPLHGMIRMLSKEVGMEKLNFFIKRAIGAQAYMGTICPESKNVSLILHVAVQLRLVSRAGKILCRG